MKYSIIDLQQPDKNRVKVHDPAAGLTLLWRRVLMTERNDSPFIFRNKRNMESMILPTSLLFKIKASSLVIYDLNVSDTSRHVCYKIFSLTLEYKPFDFMNQLCRHYINQSITLLFNIKVIFLPVINYNYFLLLY